MPVDGSVETVLVICFIAVTKYLIRSKLKERRVYSGSHSRVQSVMGRWE